MKSLNQNEYLEKTYGHYAPNTKEKAMMAITRALPNSWIGQRLGFALRKLVKRKNHMPFDVDVFGMRMRLFPHDNKCEKRVLCLPQLFDPQERLAIKEFIEGRGARPITFIDLGANIGLYSLYVQSLFKQAGNEAHGAKIIAVEADPYIYERLQNNIGLNNNVINILPAAVSDKDGRIDLHINTHNRGQNSILAEANDNASSSQGSLNVESVRLTTLLKRYDIKAPDIVKFDLEGAESIVLNAFFKEADKTHYPSMVLIESDKNANPAVFALLRERGYKLQSQTKNNSIFVYETK